MSISRDDIFRYQAVSNLGSFSNSQLFAYVAAGVLTLMAIPPLMLVHNISIDCNKGRDEDQRKSCKSQKIFGIVSSAFLCWFIVGIIIYYVYSFFPQQSESFEYENPLHAQKKLPISIAQIVKGTTITASVIGYVVSGLGVILSGIFSVMYYSHFDDPKRQEKLNTVLTYFVGSLILAAISTIFLLVRIFQ